MIANCQVACAFFGREELENLADVEANSFDGLGGSLSEEVRDTCAIGFRSGEYLGKEKILAPARRMS
jgi:hypothetical protein